MKLGLLCVGTCMSEAKLENLARDLNSKQRVESISIHEFNGPRLHNLSHF